MICNVTGLSLFCVDLYLTEIGKCLTDSVSIYVCAGRSRFFTERQERRLPNLYFLLRVFIISEMNNQELEMFIGILIEEDYNR